jgi:hypothetical protein
LDKVVSSVACTGQEQTLAECVWQDHENSVKCRAADSVAGIVCTASKWSRVNNCFYFVEASLNICFTCILLEVCEVCYM